MTSTIGARSFRDKLITWHDQNPRDLPWKQTEDPYKIWLSEIILQQTQVSQGIPYYNHFVAKYPRVQDLAAATEDQVLNDWQGLGYNSRARNLHKAAITVTKDHGGVFPSTYRGLMDLPGVGSYTAAAVASFAHGEEVPVIDANVIRVLSRALGIQTPPSSSASLKQMRQFLEQAIRGADPAEFNQAIMNFGAGVCKPRNPSCDACPFQEECFARQNDLVSLLPIKKKKGPRRERHFHYLVLTTDEGLYLNKRTTKDVWQGMYDFPLRELSNEDEISSTDIMRWMKNLTNSTGQPSFETWSDVQLLTHQRITCTFYTFSVEKPQFDGLNNEITFAAFENLHTFAVPKVIDCYFKAKSIFL